MHHEESRIGQSDLRLNLRRFWAGAAMAALALVGASSPLANAAEKRFGLTNFDRVELRTDAVLEIVTRSPVFALASGSQDAIDRLQIEARDGRLIINSLKFAGDERRRKDVQPLKIQLSAPMLRELMVVGSGDVHAAQLRGAQINIGLRGSGRVRVDQILGDRMALQMVGNGSMTLSGQVKQATVQLSGANQLNGQSLALDDLTMEADGVGDHQLRAMKRAAITVRGTTNVDVAGRPVCTVRNMGSGTILCGDGAR
jgi:hypothetical protein